MVTQERQGQNKTIINKSSLFIFFLMSNKSVLQLFLFVHPAESRSICRCVREFSKQKSFVWPLFASFTEKLFIPTFWSKCALEMSFFSLDGNINDESCSCVYMKRARGWIAYHYLFIQRFDTVGAPTDDDGVQINTHRNIFMILTPIITITNICVGRH